MGHHFERGRALFALKRYREAIDEYRQELVDDPSCAASHTNIAASLFNLNQLADAEAAVLDALAANPAYAHAYYLRARILERRGELLKAEQAAAEATRLSHTADYFYELGRLRLIQSRVNDAFAALDTALQLDPRHERTLLLRADVLKDRGRTDEAQQLLQAALGANPESAAAHSKAGRLALDQRDNEAALDFLENARRIDPVNQLNADELAAARGRLMWPISLVDRGLRRLEAWRPFRRWSYVAAIATAAVVIRASQLVHPGPVEWLLTAAYVLAGLSLLPLWSPSLLDVPARVLAKWRHRREFQYGWRQFASGELWHLLIIAAFVLAPVAFAGYAAAAYPGIDYCAAIILIFNETMFFLAVTLGRWAIPALIPLGILLWKVTSFSRTLIVTHPAAALGLWIVLVALSAIGPLMLRHHATQISPLNGNARRP